MGGVDRPSPVGYAVRNARAGRWPQIRESDRAPAPREPAAGVGEREAVLGIDRHQPPHAVRLLPVHHHRHPTAGAVPDQGGLPDAQVVEQAPDRPRVEGVDAPVRQDQAVAPGQQGGVAGPVVGGGGAAVD